MKPPPLDLSGCVPLEDRYEMEDDVKRRTKVNGKIVETKLAKAFDGTIGIQLTIENEKGPMHQEEYTFIPGAAAVLARDLTKLLGID